MSTLTVRCKVGSRGEESAPPLPPPPKPPSRIARQLALAYYIERLVERGVLRDYADAARRFEISRARTTQVLNLLLLPIPVQEEVLVAGIDISERGLRAPCSRLMGDWARRPGSVVTSQDLMERD